ncbi:MAG TPA: UPF0262 family protein [Acetobacteraceae bacterium]|jgi:uncharacterized protein (UPF0262 family)|nr:UPF0262 family protein [Acetobacteraceae bacterium]
MTLQPDARLARVVLDGEALTRISPLLEAERAQAVADLAAGSRFAVVAVKSAKVALGPPLAGRSTAGQSTPGKSTAGQSTAGPLPHGPAAHGPATPGQSAPGPYELRLSIWEGRLVFDVRHVDGAKVKLLGLALGPFRGLIKDYQLLVESHTKAVEEGREARIQAIDMGRRGLHNEGATLLCQRLDGKIDMDFDTARRLFTLVCVLHTRV